MSEKKKAVCGWCADDLHHQCVGTVRVFRKDKQGVYEKEWDCGCQH
jgi:hypothetical protein